MSLQQRVGFNLLPELCFLMKIQWPSQVSQWIRIPSFVNLDLDQLEWIFFGFSSWNFTSQIQLEFERTFNRCSFNETMPFVASFGLCPMLQLIEILTPLHQYCDGKTVFSIFDIFIQQDTVHGLCPSGKGIPSCTLTCHLVGSSQTWHWRVTGATHTEFVWKCQKQSVFWLQPEWSVKCESGCSPGFCLNPPTVSSQAWKPSPRCCVSQGHWHKLHFLWWIFSWVHKKCSGIPGSGVNGVLDKLNQLMSDQWQKSQWVGRSLRWCHPSVTSGTAYPKVVVVNSLPLQDAVLHGANRMSSCPSSPPAHFPSPPDEGITIHASGAPGPCNRKLGPTLFDFHCLQCNDWGMICWVYSVTTKDQVSSPRSPGEDAAWSGKNTPPTQMSRLCQTKWWLAEGGHG